MNNEKSFKVLLDSVSFKHLSGPDPSSIIVDKVTTDSRKICGNDLFVALVGSQNDGHHYLADVIAKGCHAIIVEDGRDEVNQFINSDTCIISVNNSRESIANIASAFFDFPQNRLKFIGITGTNGKTTVSYLLEKVFVDQGIQVGVIGTVNYRFIDRQGYKQQFPAPFTTPDPLILQKQLQQMVAAGVTHVIMEVSSHALQQKRLGNIQFDVAAFTNLSHDHLDFHGSMEKYFQAKSLLFSHHLKLSGKAVVTYKDSTDIIDNRWSSTLTLLLKEQGISTFFCGKNDDALFQPLQVEERVDGLVMSLRTPEGKMSMTSPLVGRFNVDNIMTTLGVAATMGLGFRLAIQSLEFAKGAPGRLERIELIKGEEQRSVVFVDYAHTPDALLNVLVTLKELPHKRLFCVFGCGGDRDVAKRPEMGRIAAELSDVVIVTDDNPRTESSTAIIQQIVGGIVSAGMEEMSMDLLHEVNRNRGCVVIPERTKAITRAIDSASSDDIVLIAGKGHEKYQLTNQGKRFFDDCLEAREALFSWDTSRVSRALGILPSNTSIDYSFSGVCTDSRTFQKGEIFIALQGENFDGHDYLDKVSNSDTGCIVASNQAKVDGDTNVPIYLVPDTLRALGDLAGYRRKLISELSAPLVIGITGSSGKTTVKEMVAAILQKRWPNGDSEPLDRVLCTQGNFNNLIGLPLSLLPLQLKHKAVVLEMGMNQPGEISRLAEIADPDISCIINVHGAHLEGLGSIEGVAQAKEELFTGTRQDGILIINLDDPHLALTAEKYEHKKITFTMDEGLRDTADLWASSIEIGSNGNMSFILHIGEESQRLNLQVPGRHNIANCLAAAAITHAGGTEIDVIANGLEAFRSTDKRLEIIRSQCGYHIINDTYNANPASMAAGLDTLSSMPGTVKIAILGDMLELGKASKEAHMELGRIAVESGINYLALCGSFAEFIARGAFSAGMDEQAVHVFKEKNDINKWLKELEEGGVIEQDSWVLVKASRGMRFETIVEKIAANTLQ